MISILCWILGEFITTACESFQSSFTTHFQISQRIVIHSVIPRPEALSTDSLFFLESKFVRSNSYGNIGLVSPVDGLIGKPIMWLKQQSPLLRLCSSLCCSTSSIQNGLFRRRSNNLF